MPESFSRPDLTSPSSVAETTFSSARRGYRPDEVRLVLRDVAAEMTRLQARVVELTGVAEARNKTESARSARGGINRFSDLDDDTVRQVLGEEMVKVLQTAREAAAEVVERGEHSAAQLIREASTQATAMRHEAELEVARLRTEAASQAQGDVDRAREQGREMVAEAQAYRDKLMAEAGRRRDAAREQIDRLLEGRERMVEVFERAQRVAREVLEDLGPAATPEPYVDLRVGDSGSVPVVPPSVATPPFDLAGDEDFSGPAPAEADVEPEPVAVEPEPDPAEDSNVVNLFPAHKVEGLFAKLRAETGTSTPDPVGLEPVESNPLESSPVVVSGAEPEEAIEPEIDDSVFGQREASVVPLIVASARKIKRILADEQNEVLGLMRAASSVTSVEDLVTDAVAHTARYVEAMSTELAAAHLAGAGTSGEGVDESTKSVSIASGDLERITTFVAGGLVEPLRSRLDRAVLDVGGDIDDSIRRVRAVYREWKTQHIDQHLEDVMRLAYGLGVVAGVPTGTKMCWLMDPKGVPCPDAEDNSLAGEVASGDPYPTGHTYAPAYPGCRCLVLPAAKIAESS
jgi:DivIVA domain-containing protein